MKPKFYILDMFPYPSGKGLHIGHAVGYIATDIYARWKKNQGFEVCHPMGFDSFGLPTEYYAMTVGKSCEEVTETNISNFKKQLELLKLDLDWNREIRTSDPGYYRWTQWVFLQLYGSWFNPSSNKAESLATYTGNNPDSVRLAYKATYEANWCEALQTTLSDDEITDGKSDRGGYPVTRKQIPSWFLRIIPYKERLIEGLKSIEWENKKVQKNWIPKLHDINFSRQRKWGEPIPLPGETDTMPSIAGSNWYFFRYLDATNTHQFCSQEAQRWLPVDLYVGGSEHTTGHVLYARFITKVLYDLGHSIVDEPFTRLKNVGLMMGPDGQKMAKSRGNVVTPEEIIAKHGVNAFRMGICFLGRFEDIKSWNEGSIKGCAKFLQKVRDTKTEKVEDPAQNLLVQQLESKVSIDIQNFSFNTCVSKFMICLDALKTKAPVSQSAFRKFLKILDPFAPDIGQTLLGDV